jgi:hypothetical protein
MMPMCGMRPHYSSGMLEGFQRPNNGFQGDIRIVSVASASLAICVVQGPSVWHR